MDSSSDPAEAFLELRHQYLHMFEDWAGGKGGLSYDQYTKSVGYNAPERVVELAIPFLSKDKPILDVGAGTGKVGKILSEQGFVVDGFDYSKNMLNRAQGKGYRNLWHLSIEDVIKFGTPIEENYGAIVSAGVFGDFTFAGFLEYLLQRIPVDVVSIGGEPKDWSIKGFVRSMETNNFHVKRDMMETCYIRPNGERILYRYVVAIR